MQNDGIANTITNRASTVGANIVVVNFEVSVIIFGVGSEAKGKQDKLWILYNTKVLHCGELVMIHHGKHLPEALGWKEENLGGGGALGWRKRT